MSARTHPLYARAAVLYVKTFNIDVHTIESSTIMDETNAKREARRRRILENSENRLRMITSKRNLEETEGKYNHIHC